jgi:hypothetical protein
VQQNENECRGGGEMQRTRGQQGGRQDGDARGGTLAAGGAGASSDRLWTARAWSRIGDGVWRGGVESSLAEQDSGIRFRMRWKQWMSGRVDSG